MKFPKFFLGCLVHVRIDFEHGESDCFCVGWGLFDDMAVHEANVGLTGLAIAESPFGVCAFGNDQLPCLRLA